MMTALDVCNMKEQFKRDLAEKILKDIDMEIISEVTSYCSSSIDYIHTNSFLKDTELHLQDKLDIYNLIVSDLKNRGFYVPNIQYEYITIAWESKPKD